MVLVKLLATGQYLSTVSFKALTCSSLASVVRVVSPSIPYNSGLIVSSIARNPLKSSFPDKETEIPSKGTPSLPA